MYFYFTSFVIALRCLETIIFERAVANETKQRKVPCSFHDCQSLARPRSVASHLKSAIYAAQPESGHRLPAADGVCDSLDVPLCRAVKTNGRSREMYKRYIVTIVSGLSITASLRIGQLGMPCSLMTSGFLVQRQMNTHMLEAVRITQRGFRARDETL